MIPDNESVQIIEHSDDVIHSFWVPEFLFKRDVIPYGTQAQQKASGLADNRFQFTPTTDGSYVGRCAELCGTYHSQMNFEVRVVSAAGVHQVPGRAASRSARTTRRGSRRR